MRQSVRQQGGVRPCSVTYMRYAKIKMRANGIKIRKLKKNAAPTGLFLVGAIDFYPNAASLVLKLKPLRGDMFVKLIYVS